MMPRIFLLGLLLLAACLSDRPRLGPSEEGTGTLLIHGNLEPQGTPDRDGIWVTVGAHRTKLPASGRDLVLSDLAAGGYTVQVDSLDPWCEADPPAGTVTITAGDTAEASFTVRCETLESTVRVVVQTSVIDAGPGSLTLLVNGAPTTLAPNDTTFVHGAAWAATQLALVDLAVWCAPSAWQQLVPFSATDTITATFTITCGPAYRQSRLSLEALGTDPSATLTLRLGPSPSIRLHPGVDTTVTFRVDQNLITIDSVRRGCVAFVTPGQVAAGGPVGTPHPTPLQVGCGRLSALEGPANGPVSLVERALDGTDPAVLATGLRAGIRSWLSPDAEWILGWEMRCPLSSCENRLYREALAGGDSRELTDWEPGYSSLYRWGPDSDHITWSESDDDGSWTVVTQHRDGGDIDTIPLPLRVLGGVAWDPTGERLIARALRPVDSTFWQSGLMVARPGDVDPIKFFLRWDYADGFTWSRDGTRVAFIDQTGRPNVLWVGSGTIVPTGDTILFNHADTPDWDGTGSMIAYVRGIYDPSGSARAIYVAPAAGGPERRVGTVLVRSGPFFAR